MPTYVIYDPASAPVANLVTQILTSFDGGREGELGANKLKEPDLSGVNLAASMKVSGAEVVNLTAQEIPQIADARNAARLGAKNIFIAPNNAENQAIALGFETVLEMVVSEINILRAAVSPPLSARTAVQVKTAFRNTYEGKIDSLT